MLLSLARSALLCLCTAASFAVLGRAPGAITLRTGELQATIAADSLARTKAAAGRRLGWPA